MARGGGVRVGVDKFGLMGVNNYLGKKTWFSGRLVKSDLIFLVLFKVKSSGASLNFLSKLMVGIWNSFVFLYWGFEVGF